MYRIGACGGYFTHPNGILTSPSYPNNYPYDADCVYTITVPAGNVIQISFLSLDVDEQFCGQGAGYLDHLELRDGPCQDSTLIGKFCGSKEKIYNHGSEDDVPDPIQSTHNNLRLRYKEHNSLYESLPPMFFSPVIQLTTSLILGLSLTEELLITQFTLNQAKDLRSNTPLWPH